jgi:NADH dehydrogenase
MNQNIIIAGSGFAGMWAALSAARAVSLAGQQDAVRITVVSPEASLHIRPRLYETAFDDMAPEIGPLFAAVGVHHLVGKVETIDAAGRQVTVTRNDGTSETLPYDRFVLAAGSSLFMPEIRGLKEHAFNVDQLWSARALHAHLESLAGQPDTPARNTIVVAGGGFTGIETAAEMPSRLQGILGPDAKVRVVVLERAPAIGWDLGPVPRPVIEEALAECGVEIKAGAGAVSVDAGGVTTSTGEYIPSSTVIWTAGMRASSLAAQIRGEHDALGRVHADAYLHAAAAPGIFVTGDTALAATDNEGHVASMSCQHALSLGRIAGHNAAAELVGLPLHPYSQPKYVTCLDLGPWGAIFTEGWDRHILLTRDVAKATKREINTKWIYPPQPDRDAVFAAANPAHVIVP